MAVRGGAQSLCANAGVVEGCVALWRLAIGNRRADARRNAMCHTAGIHSPTVDRGIGHWRRFGVEMPSMPRFDSDRAACATPAGGSSGRAVRVGTRRPAGGRTVVGNSEGIATAVAIRIRATRGPHFRRMQVANNQAIRGMIQVYTPECFRWPGGNGRLLKNSPVRVPLRAVCPLVSSGNGQAHSSAIRLGQPESRGRVIRGGSGPTSEGGLGMGIREQAPRSGRSLAPSFPGVPHFPPA
jgi:hypothetical protein